MERSTLDIVKDCVADALKKPNAKVSEDESLIDLKADSLDLVAIRLKLMDCFELQSSNDPQLEMLHISNTVGEVSQYIDTLLVQ